MYPITLPATRCKRQDRDVPALSLLAGIPLLLASLLTLVATPAHGDESFPVFADGKAMACIVLSADASDDLRKAVEEFRRDLREGYDIDIPLDIAADVPGRIELVVEERALATEDKTAVTFPEASVMRISGGGAGVRRTLFWLLEEFGGIRYLYQGGEHGTHFPPCTELVIPRRTIERSSEFTVGRMTGRSRYTATRRYFWQWEVRLGAKAPLFFNHALTSHPGPPGGGIAFPLEAYQQSDTKPPDEVFPILNDQRFVAYKHVGGLARSRWQPCFTSPEAVDEAVRNLTAYLREHPSTVSLSLGVNDVGGHCQCQRCLAVDHGGERSNSMGFVDRSESYYRWVSQVAGRIAKEFPNIVFGLIAYREVLDPPSEPLHPSVVPVLCFDFQATLDPKIESERKELIRGWSRKAQRLGFWAYDAGFYQFSLPRLYFEQQRNMIRFIHDHRGAFGYSSGAHYFTANEGPKVWLFFRLLENPDLDLETALNDWCRACVGDAAAPDLRAYYAFWEEFWRSRAVKTPWWESRDNVYLFMGYFQTYMYALAPGDIVRCRQLMDGVVAKAREDGTDAQQRRAELQRRIFEWYEAAAIASAGEFFDPDGMLPDAGAAQRLLANIPRAQMNFERWQEIPAEIPNWYAHGLITKRVNAGMIADTLLAVSRFLNAEPVRAELGTLAANAKLPSNLRFVARTMLKGADGDDTGNLIANGGLENSAEHGWTTTHEVHGDVGRAAGVAATGQHALRCDVQHGNYTILHPVTGTEPSTAYYISARLFIPADQQTNLEGRVEFWGNPGRQAGTRNAGWPGNIPPLQLDAGKWHYIHAVVPSHMGTDSVRIHLRLANFQKGAVVYLDDLRMFEIPNAEAP